MNLKLKEDQSKERTMEAKTQPVVSRTAVVKKMLSESKEPKYDFPVSLLPLKTANGITVPNRAVYRSDTKKVIAVVGADYHLISHKKVLDQLEGTLPILTGTRKISLCKQGNYMFANYESNKIDSAEPRKGDIVKFGIQIFNSYNGRLPLGMRLYALRLKCLNGMTSPQSISSLHVRHIEGANIVGAREVFMKKIEAFQKFSPIWTKWANTKCPKGRMDTFLKSYLNKGAREIVENKYVADQDDTLWGLFNALTYFGTHIVQVRGAKNRQADQVSVAKLPDLAKKQFSYDRNVVEKFYKYNWA